MSTFLAIDFETATAEHDSACAVGLAAGCGGRMVLARTYLIRPPSARFTFTGLHGIDWEHVRDAPTFADLWPTLGAWIKPAAFVAAHNAAFDRSVLHACCARYRLLPTRNAFVCTVELARRQWTIYPTTLPDVCRALRISLQHHDAGQDAVACARIVLAAEAAGWTHRRPPPRSAGVVRTTAVALRTLTPARGLAPASSSRIRIWWSRLRRAGARRWPRRRAGRTSRKSSYAQSGKR